MLCAEGGWRGAACWCASFSQLIEPLVYSLLVDAMAGTGLACLDLLPSLGQVWKRTCFSALEHVVKHGWPLALHVPSCKGKYSVLAPGDTGLSSLSSIRRTLRGPW